jgi:hypothetical protein
MRNGSAANLLSPADVGQRLGYSAERIRQMCEQGLLPGAYRPGGAAGTGTHWKIPTEAVEAFLAASRPQVRRPAGAY